MIELKNQGSDVTLEQILLNISERDQKDSNRKADPLKKQMMLSRLIQVLTNLKNK